MPVKLFSEVEMQAEYGRHKILVELLHDSPIRIYFSHVFNIALVDL